MSRVITMIPARMASSRLPNKILLDVNGKSVLQRVYENVKAVIEGDVVIAAGDKEIVDLGNNLRKIEEEFIESLKVYLVK